LLLDPKTAPTTSINDHGDGEAEEVEDKEPKYKINVFWSKQTTQPIRS
jgi:hypothetical protein